MGATMPVWGAVALALGVALVTQIGALLLQWQRHAHECEVKRAEEWHRNLRWGTDHIVAGGDVGLLVGVSVLDALDDEPNLPKSDSALIDSILAGVFPDTSDSGAEENYNHQQEEGGAPDDPDH